MMQQLRDIRAAALEASGIDRSAAVVYADCIESQLKSCGRFDASIVAWLREWWVGRGYGRSVVRREIRTDHRRSPGKTCVGRRWIRRVWKDG